MGRIKAKTTYYNGYKFRSRLEARWAVFFDSLGVEYEYEPEGFELPSGKSYLPDFRVKCYGLHSNCDNHPFNLWVEVKGQMSEYDAERIREFADSNPILVIKNIPEHGNYHLDGQLVFQDDCYSVYPAVSEENFYLMSSYNNLSNHKDVDDILKAYDDARCSRFEFRDAQKKQKKCDLETGLEVFPKWMIDGENEKKSWKNRMIGVYISVLVKCQKCPEVSLLELDELLDYLWDHPEEIPDYWKKREKEEKNLIADLYRKGLVSHDYWLKFGR